MTSCENSRNPVSDHFADVRKMVNIGSGAERELDDCALSRYACYLIVQNGDSRKKVIAFQNKGYQGLYGGLGRKEIHARKGLKKSQNILDHMGSTELAANLFRATQTEEKLRKEHMKKFLTNDDK